MLIYSMLKKLIIREIHIQNRAEVLNINILVYFLLMIRHSCF